MKENNSTLFTPMGKIHELSYLGESNWKSWPDLDRYELFWCLKQVYEKGENKPLPFTVDFKKRLAFALGCEESFLKLFSTINTPLDMRMGIDFFVLLQLNESSSKFATFDITLKSWKLWKKSNFLITPQTLNKMHAFIAEVTEFLKHKENFFYHGY